MSRRLPSSQRPRVYQPTSDNPYQITTLAAPHAYGHHQQQHNPLQYAKDNFRRFCSNSHRGGGGGICNNVATYEGVSDDDTCTDSNTYYNCHNYGYQHMPTKTDCMFSDNSDSTRLPYYTEIGAPKRFSRHDAFYRGDAKLNSSIHKNGGAFRKIYPNRENFQRSPDEEDIAVPNRNLALPVVSLSRLSDRPQSSISSGVTTSIIVDGCGGHCQTFENVCYYFLQVAFTMGILIGTSLSIAGAVLRKSAARNLQVLVYIGALLSLVSALLLAIQCSARYSARKRKKALRNSKRTTIPLETLHSTRPIALQQQPLIGDQNLRGLPTIQLQMPLPHVPIHDEEQGIPWWRRNDLTRV